MSLKKMRTAALTALAVPALVGSIMTAPAQAEVKSGTNLTYSSPSQDLSSQYHVYADNIDWSQPVGVVFYFDGDYNKDDVDSSFFYNPESNTMRGMAQAAQEHNMVFVSLDTPDTFGTTDTNDYATWWQETDEDSDKHGNYLRGFAKKFIADSGIDESQVWLMGYSGGAEFITQELDADQQGTWRSGGGSIMVGGGGKPDRMQTQAPQNIKSQLMSWWVNDGDIAGATHPSDWSARDAVHAGQEWYTQQGFNTEEVHDAGGKGHTDYDLPGILRQSLNSAG